MGIRWCKSRRSLHYNEVALFLGRCSRYSKTPRICGSSDNIMRALVCSPFIHGVRTRTSCAATAATQAQAAGVLGLTPLCCRWSFLSSFRISGRNSQLGPLTKLRVFGRSQQVKNSRNGLGRAMTPECVHMSHGMLWYLWCHMSHFTSSSSSSSSSVFYRGLACGPSMQRGRDRTRTST
jgi:hypothetical protein